VDEDERLAAINPDVTITKELLLKEKTRKRRKKDFSFVKARKKGGERKGGRKEDEVAGWRKMKKMCEHKKEPGRLFVFPC